LLKQPDKQELSRSPFLQRYRRIRAPIELLIQLLDEIENVAVQIADAKFARAVESVVDVLYEIDAFGLRAAAKRGFDLSLL